MYRVETFGNDCLGNITGYRVCTGYGFNRVNAPDGVFCGDIYIHGSYTRASQKANALCVEMNAARVDA